MPCSISITPALRRAYGMPRWYWPTACRSWRPPGCWAERFPNAWPAATWRRRFSTRRRPAAGCACYLLGAAPGVADRAAANIMARWPAVRVVGTYSPPLGFERDAAENESILARHRRGAARRAAGRTWARRSKSCGSTLIAIESRPPWRCASERRSTFWQAKNAARRVWMRRVGLEWLHRVASEPRRLLGRYLRDAWIFPQLVWREWALQRSAANR